MELRDRVWQRHVLSRRIGVLGNQDSLRETYYFSGIFGFLPSGTKTCRWDSSVAEIDAVPWLQFHFQQPFLVTRNILRVCLCCRNKLSGLWALWVSMNDFCSVTKLTANSTMPLGILSRFIRYTDWFNLIKLKLKGQLSACSWQLLKFLTELFCRELQLIWCRWFYYHQVSWFQENDNHHYVNYLQDKLLCHVTNRNISDLVGLWSLAKLPGSIYFSVVCLLRN